MRFSNEKNLLEFLEQFFDKSPTCSHAYDGLTLSMNRKRLPPQEHQS